MPADIIVPGLAAAWNNASAATIGQPAVVSALCRTTANLTAFTQITSSIDGVTLQGTGATAQSRLVLVNSQSTQSQNGIYAASSAGSSVALTGSFSAGGTLTKSGLTVGRLYYWTKGNGTQISNGSGSVILTESGFIAPDISGNVTITGPANTAITDTMSEASLARATLFDSVEELPVDLVVRVDQGSGTKPEWWRNTAQPLIMGTSSIVFAQTSSVSITPGRATTWDNTSATTITPGRAAAWSNTPADAIPPIP